MEQLRSKVVLITGAGRGSGRILAQAFAEHGAIAALNDISPINVEQVVEQVIARGGQARAYIDDVAKKVAVQQIINQVEDDFGAIDILVNHAAVEPDIPLLDMDEWDWHRTLDVNLTGAFLMTQSVGRVMRARGTGMIVNLISPSIRAESRGDKAAFLSSMSGLARFTQQAARELSPYGIDVYPVENVPGQIVETVFALLEGRSEE
jgi:NAD(P)-dependent dehydrogenase (short-subunit alcohol dehydrogenase family)